MIGAAAAAEDPHPGKCAPEIEITSPEIDRIACIERFGFVEFGVTLGRGVGADTMDTPDPGLARLQCVVEMRWMRAVDQKILRRPIGLAVDGLDRLPQRFASHQAAIGLHGERDGRGNPLCLGGAGDADRLIDAVERVGRDHVGAAFDERRDLLAVIGLGFIGIHIACLVAVAARADGAADDAGRAARPFPAGTQFLEERDRTDIDRLECCRIVAKFGGPIRIGAPCRAVEHEARAVVARDREVAGVILLQFLPALGIIEQHERGEVRQFNSLVKYQRRFHAAIGEKYAALALRQVLSVLGHINNSENLDTVGRSLPPRQGPGMLVPQSVAAS